MVGILISIFALLVAAGVIGFALGVALTRKGCTLMFREHLEVHSVATHPDATCVFCHEERPVIFAGVRLDEASGKFHVNNAAGADVNKLRPQGVNALDAGNVNRGRV
jgi:hypothetical protein